MSSDDSPVELIRGPIFWRGGCSASIQHGDQLFKVNCFADDLGGAEVRILMHVGLIQGNAKRTDWCHAANAEESCDQICERIAHNPTTFLMRVMLA